MRRLDRAATGREQARDRAPCRRKLEEISRLELEVFFEGGTAIGADADELD